MQELHSCFNWTWVWSLLEKFHLLNQNRVILFLCNYITIGDTEISVGFRRTGSDDTKTHEPVLQGFGVMLTYKDICPTSCLPPWISSQPLDSSYQNVHYLKGDIVSTMKNMSYWCLKFYSNVSWDKENLSVPNFIYALPETLTVVWYKLSDKFD